MAPLSLGILRHRTLQSVIDSAGMESKLGVAAASQLVWTCNAQNEPARGLAYAESALRSSAASADQRIQVRWAAAIMSQRLGDRQRARADYEGLLREVAGQPVYEQLVADIQQRLAGL
jgi:hypothetical protein